MLIGRIRSQEQDQGQGQDQGQEPPLDLFQINTILLLDAGLTLIINLS